ncbi:hypothetical protein ACH5RR_027655 [Cinchona calisaya]|uniref:Helicase C-terminal domain-containing protein n=1 Tax=Cinchona calisaya TaxID=153742 RepID=A0ABD2YQG9_9GENT
MTEVEKEQVKMTSSWWRHASSPTERPNPKLVRGRRKKTGALDKFKAGECNILPCTDVASRGLDIPSVDTVINYDIPTNSKDYIHQVGRTARAGRSGVAISLVNQYELEWYIQTEKLIGMKTHCTIRVG